MKRNNDNLFTISVYVFLTALAVLLFAVVLFNLNSVGKAVGAFLSAIRSVIVGIVIALILNPTLSFFEDKFSKLFCKKKDRPKLCHTLGMIVTYLLFLIMVASIVTILIPQLIDAVTTLKNQSEGYLSGLQGRIDSFLEKVAPHLPHGDESDPLHIDLTEVIHGWIGSMINAITGALPRLVTFATDAFTEFKDYFLGIIISVYFLGFRKTVKAGTKRVTAAIFSEKVYGFLSDFGTLSYRTYINFFTLKFYDAAILTCLFYVALALTRIPYAILIGLIIGVLNLIPFLGAIIGGLIGGIITLIFAPQKLLIYLIIVVAVQMLDAYVIERFIIGASLEGVSNFWILVSVTVLGGLFDFLGMLLAAPTFAMLRILSLRLVNHIRAKRAAQKEPEEET